MRWRASRTGRRRAAGHARLYAVCICQSAEASGTRRHRANGLDYRLYTVLVDGDDMNEPIADAVRGILDGHIVLNRNIANKGHFPAIDVLASISRVMKDISPEEQIDASENVKRLMAIYKDSEDLINIGAYQQGSNADIDESIEYIGRIWDFTKQK